MNIVVLVDAFVYCWCHFIFWFIVVPSVYSIAICIIWFLIQATTVHCRSSMTKWSVALLVLRSSSVVWRIIYKRWNWLYLDCWNLYLELVEDYVCCFIESEWNIARMNRIDGFQFLASHSHLQLTQIINCEVNVAFIALRPT